MSTLAVDRDHTLRLPDHRTLSYAIYGPLDGRPVLFLHGFPSCRLEAAGLSSTGLLDGIGVRLVCPDRPGFGRSTASPERSIVGYADDLEALLEHLGLASRITGKEDTEGKIKSVTKYAIVGGSGGGPYALACASIASQHPDRFRNLNKVGVLAGAPPYLPPMTVRDSSTQVDSQQQRINTRELQKHWPTSSRLIFAFAEHLPQLCRAIGVIAMKTTSWLYSTAPGRRMIEQALSTWMGKIIQRANETKPTGSTIPQDSHSRLTETDAPLEHSVAGLTELAQETWAQGPHGWLGETRLLGRPWGFDPASIRCTSADPRHRCVPVKIWHGSEDLVAPLASMKWMTNRIVGAELKVLEGKDHFDLGHSMEEVLAWTGT